MWCCMSSKVMHEDVWFARKEKLPRAAATLSVLCHKNPSTLVFVFHTLYDKDVMKNRKCMRLPQARLPVLLANKGRNKRKYPHTPRSMHMVTMFFRQTQEILRCLQQQNVFWAKRLFSSTRRKKDSVDPRVVFGRHYSCDGRSL